MLVVNEDHPFVPLAVNAVRWALYTLIVLNLLRVPNDFAFLRLGTIEVAFFVIKYLSNKDNCVVRVNIRYTMSHAVSFNRFYPPIFVRLFCSSF